MSAHNRGMHEQALRDQLARVLDWNEAHVGFDKAVDGIPSDKRGARATGFEHSPWQLLEHMRLAQDDILDFCTNPNYVHNLKSVSYTHLRAHETPEHLVCRLLLEK